MAVMNEAVAKPAARELVITRVFAAPRELVWQAWTEREHMMRWCAPHDFVITHGEGAARVGDSWRSCMVSPAGEEHWVGGVYREVVENKKLVFTHAWDEADQPRHETLVTVILADDGAKTKMTFRQENFRSLASRDGHEGGWSESFERLDSYLQELSAGD